MEINKNQLISETAKLGNEIHNGLSLDRVGREYSSFLAMNSIIANLTIDGANFMYLAATTDGDSIANFLPPNVWVRFLTSRILMHTSPMVISI